MEEDMAGRNEFKKCYFEKKKKGVNIFHLCYCLNIVFESFRVFSKEKKKKMQDCFGWKTTKKRDRFQAVVTRFMVAYSRIGRNKRARLNSTL